MIESHKLYVQRTAHISVISALNHPEFVWLVAHGYGQLASKFIHKFENLPPNHSIYAPEGLSKFYWNGVSGEPVASWMTKHQREDEIEDQMNYLDDLNQSLLQGVLKYGGKLILLGFSQGGATLWRWIEHSRIDFHAYINWATWPPEDIDYTSMASYLSNKNLIYCRGTKDPYYSDERKTQFLDRMHSWPFDFEMINFDGGHEIDREVLGKMARSLD